LPSFPHEAKPARTAMAKTVIPLKILFIIRLNFPFFIQIKNHSRVYPKIIGGKVNGNF